MLPNFLYGSYKRYKAVTSSFVDWVVETAKKCGHKATVNDASATTTKSSGREKSNGSTATAKYKITLKELSSLAQTIAQSTVSVPPIILATVKRAIALRKRCASWFSASRKCANLADVSHSHFIKVLEELCEILEWKSATRPTAPQQPAIISKSQDQASSTLNSNSFAALSLQESDEPGKPPVSQSHSPDQPIVEIEEGETDDDDPLSLLFFHVYCMFEDLQNIREFVNQTVAEYRDSKIDVMNLAVVSDTAIHLARQLISEVVSTWSHIPQLRDEEQLQKFMFVVACEHRGINGELTPDPTVPYNVDMDDVATWCYLPIFILLESFKAVLQPNQLPIFKKGHYGYYDSAAVRDRMTAGQKFNEDKIILLELLPEFALLQQCNIKALVTDEATAGLVEFIKTKKVPVWLSFATQILLDVHHGLRHSNHKAFNDLRVSALRTKKIIEEYWELNKTFKAKPKFWPKEGDDSIKGVHDQVQAWVTGDLIYDFKNNSLPQNIKANLRAAGGVEKHFLLKGHGVMCGLIAFNITLHMQHIGLSLINQWYDVAQMAYLYEMARQTGIHNFGWPDMDVFIDLHGEERVFVGGRPKTPDEALKKLRMATGISSPSDFARNSRQGGRPSLKEATGKARLMEPSVAIKNMFYDRYLMHGPSRMSVENVDKLIEEIVPNLESSNASGGQVNFSSSMSLMQSRWKRLRSLGALQLLAAIKQGLYTEEPRLQFNYFGMHKRCIELLRRIQTKEDHKFRQYFTPQYMPDDTFISNLVLLVLTVAQGSGVAMKQMGIKAGADGMVGSRIVGSCAEVMKDYLRDNGDKACKELKTFCKNKSLGEARGFEIESDKFTYWTNLEDLIDPASMAALQTGIGML